MAWRGTPSVSLISWPRMLEEAAARLANYEANKSEAKASGRQAVALMQAAGRVGEPAQPELSDRR